MRVFVVVEYIRDGEFADREYETVRGLRAAKLVRRGIDFLVVAAEISGLPDERARHACIGNQFADFISFAAGKARNAERRTQAEALIDLGIDPQLGAVP